MQFIDPDDPKELETFYREWKSSYTERNPGKAQKCENCGKKQAWPLKPPTIATMRILFQYAMHGSIPGDFMMAVLQNDLYGVFNTAPEEELEFINSTVQYVTTYLSCESWGTPEKVGKWINRMKKGRSNRPTEFY